MDKCKVIYSNDNYIKILYDEYGHIKKISVDEYRCRDAFRFYAELETTIGVPIPINNKIEII